MSIWSKIIETIGSGEDKSTMLQHEKISRDTSRFAFVDVEVGIKDRKIHDRGIYRWDGGIFHSANKPAAKDFLIDINFVCGHNIIHHDAKYLFGEEKQRWAMVDTLYVSPLLFPERPYHRLLKDDKLVSDQMNNPVNDCEKARDLMMDEVACWNTLADAKRIIYATLLYEVPEFVGFLEFEGAQVCTKSQLSEIIFTE